MSEAHQQEQKITRRGLFKRYSKQLEKNLQVSTNCLNFHGIYCASCRDECTVNAIRVQPQLGGTLAVSINHDACTQCMDCTIRCPNEALVLS